VVPTQSCWKVAWPATSRAERAARRPARRTDFIVGIEIGKYIEINSKPKYLAMLTGRDGRLKLEVFQWRNFS
jgi:non-canonical (house-cleaning) NTP pyrophosphatase